MATGLGVWSRDPAANQTTDSLAYLLEGQAASTINNAIRGAMAASAQWRDDNLGAYDSASYLTATRAAGDAYSLTTLQGITSLSTPFSLAFFVSANNQGPATLNVNSLGAKSIVRQTGVALGPGHLSTGVWYKAIWLPALNYYLIVSPAIGLPGEYVDAADSGARWGFIEANGVAVSRTSYAALFARLGVIYGAGDGSTTFNLPLHNGRARFAANTLGGVTANSLTTGAGGVNGVLGQSGGFETVTLTIGQIPSHTHTGATVASGSHSHSGTADTSGSHIHTASTTPAGQEQLNIPVQGTDSNFAFGAFNGASGNTTYTTPIFTGNHTHGVTVDLNGAHTHNLSISTASSHTHTFTTDGAGSGGAHSNMPPALISYVFISV